MKQANSSNFTAVYLAIVGEASPALQEAAQQVSRAAHPLFLCATGMQALELKLRQRPCLWLIHDQLPDISGRDCARLLAALRPFDRFVLIPDPDSSFEQHDAPPSARMSCVGSLDPADLFGQLSQLMREMSRASMEARTVVDDEDS